MLRKIGSSRVVQHAIGWLLATYLRFVRWSSREILLPENARALIYDNAPGILTFWHGQHFMQTFFRQPGDRCYVMISRHGDGEINAHAAELLGMSVVRGSGAQRKDQVRKRGGIQALRTLLGLLEQGEHVSMTADVPKISRVAGDGIITLAQLSGRPILPVAVVCSRRIDFASWDAASVALPFGRYAIVTNKAIWVPRDADAAAKEAARRELEAELDRLYAQGYAAFGQRDPGAARESVHLARAKREAETAEPKGTA
ncbi:MAG TPA: lysophospholipid acyltransferase family protein [Rhabdaerophilum sp.]|nr:lysophospholipid acyltransferase family protein [Rhabdaerophilum sp.]